MWGVLPANALELERAVEMLEASGDFETAEPVAFKLSQQKKELYYYIEFLRKYPNSDFADIVYQQTWALVEHSGNAAMLQSFVKAKPRGKHSLTALDKLFALYQQENSILAYQDYLKAFPNSPKAVNALEGIFKLAYERVSQVDDQQQTLSFLDEYIRTFPSSPYVKQANEKAEILERELLQQALDSFSLNGLFTSKQAKKDTLARELYNKMRFWQKQDQSLLAERKYRLLQGQLFIDTEAYTEMMDRDETLAFRASLSDYQQQTQQRLDQLNQLYQQESQRIVASIQAEAGATRQTIKQQAEQTRQTIADQAGQTRETINRQADNTRQAVYGMTSQVTELSLEKGRLADAVNQQTDRMLDEARRASYEQEQMFNRARESARRESRQNRNCAEVLAKNGRYTMFSGCP